MPAKFNQSSGNSKLVAPTSVPTKPLAPGMGVGAPRSVKGPKVHEKSKPSSRGMGGKAGGPKPAQMGKYKPVL